MANVLIDSAMIKTTTEKQILKATFMSNRDQITINGLPVHVGQQNDRVVVWFLVTDRTDPVYTLKIVPTGYESFSGQYVGTVQMPDGLVWHVVTVV